jgi:hypothetical protein
MVIMSGGDPTRNRSRLTVPPIAHKRHRSCSDHRVCRLAVFSGFRTVRAWSRRCCSNVELPPPAKLSGIGGLDLGQIFVVWTKLRSRWMAGRRARAPGRIDGTDDPHSMSDRYGEETDTASDAFNRPSAPAPIPRRGRRRGARMLRQPRGDALLEPTSLYEAHSSVGPAFMPARASMHSGRASEVGAAWITASFVMDDNGQSPRTTIQPRTLPKLSRF